MHSVLSRLPAVILSFCLFSLCAMHGLSAHPQDTLAVPVVQPPDTTARETPSGVDTVVAYSARDSVEYSTRTRTMELFGDGNLEYRALGLRAARIGVNWDSAMLTAGGVRDSSDTTGVREIGSPLLKDGGEEYHGKAVSYSFRTKKGRITLADTEIEAGYYYGEQIKKVEKDVLFVEYGRYTTCDADTPHFYFMSPRMKVILREVVIAEPVYFYISDVPVFALPFGVFPNRSGRRSGIIAPAFGEDGRFGRYVSHFGYYWAINDYMDLASTADWYTRGGWAGHAFMRYKLRYAFSGSLSGNISQRHEGEPQDPQWTESRDYSLQWAHNQQFDPSTNLNVNFTFSSGNYFRNYSTNLQDVLRQNIISNATFTKTWAESNRSLSVYVYRDQSLLTGDIKEQLPSLSFSQGTFFPFRSSAATRAAEGTSSEDRPWYESVGISYSANAANARNKLSRQIQVDSVRSLTGDPFLATEFERSSSQSVSQRVSLSFSPKLGYFTLSPSLSFGDDRTFSDGRTPVYDPADTSIGFLESKQQSTRGSLSAGVSTATRFYGLLQPDMLGVTAFRHTVSPSLSLTYGKQVYGQNAAPYSLSSSFSVQNLFEMKYQPSDTVKEEKIQLLNVGMGVSYNFAAQEQKWSEFSLSFRTNIGQVLNLSGHSSFNFYQFDRSAGRRTNKLLIKERGYLADLTSFGFSLSTSLRGEKKKASLPTTVLPQSDGTGLLRDPTELTSPPTLYREEDPDFSIPWNLNLNFNFSQSQSDPRRKVRSASLSADLSFNLSEQWKITARGTYDLTRKEFAAPSVNVSRDLHCWIMNFHWYPMGYLSGYRLEIRVKAPQLQDIKVTKQASARGVNW